MTNSGISDGTGFRLPRKFTAPLVEGQPGPCGCGCALTDATSYGFDLDEFCVKILGQRLDPWQRWLAIHAGELSPDGTPRFRTVLTLVARQNGKSFLGRALLLYWLFIDEVELVLGTSTDRGYAKRMWQSVCNIILENKMLKSNLKSIVKQTGEESVKLRSGAEYIFAANNGAAGRSLTVHRWLCDELRMHNGFETWASAANATNAVRDAQIFAITNQGGDEALKLHELRTAALSYIATGEGDPSLGLFEWSAEDGADPEDPEALAAANPSVGLRISMGKLRGDAAVAKKAGGEALTQFLTEVLCMRVEKLTPAIEPLMWDVCGTQTVLDLAAYRRRVAVCIDVSTDAQHASMVAAATVDGVTHVDVVAAWDGPDCTQQMTSQLPGLVRRVRPRVVGWFPTGPAAAVATSLHTAHGRGGWAPRGTTVEPITGDVAAACMGLAEAVRCGMLRHPHDPLLDQHVAGTTPQWRGDRWVYQRRGVSQIDAAYATAGATYLSRILMIRASGNTPEDDSAKAV